MRTVLLLICSNAFMTVAWYGHLRYKNVPLVAVIFVSWLIALPEYALQVPANRLGHQEFGAPNLKITQEVISISLFLLFNAFYLRERVHWNQLVAMLLIVAAVFFMLFPRFFPAGPPEAA